MFKSALEGCHAVCFAQWRRYNSFNTSETVARETHVSQLSLGSWVCQESADGFRSDRPGCELTEYTVPRLLITLWTSTSIHEV